MAINQDRLMQAVYDAIYDSLTTPPRAPNGSSVGNGRPAANPNNTILSLAFPVGLPIDASQFANAWSPLNTSGSVYAAENFATLTDDIPEVSSLYASTGRSVDTVYGQILSGVESDPPQPSTPSARQAYEDAFNFLFIDGTDYDDQGRPVTVKVDSPAYRNYKNKLTLLSAAQSTYANNYLQFDFSDPADQRRWSILSPSLLAPVQISLADFEAARPDRVENALAIVRQYEGASVAGLFNQSRRTYDLTRQGSILQPGIFWHAAEAFPGNWFAESAAANFTDITIESRSLRINESSKYSSYRGGGGFNAGFWRVRGGSSGEYSSYNLSTDTSRIKISFKFGRVEIRRRWLDPSLFSLNGWRVVGRNEGAYSSGRFDTNGGVFPLLPVSMIVARDIKVYGEWGSADLARAASTTRSGGSVGWGPFSCSGSYHRSSSTRTFVSDFDSNTISVPGIQVIGWISQLNPYMPPEGSTDEREGGQRTIDSARSINQYFDRPNDVALLSSDHGDATENFDFSFASNQNGTSKFVSAEE